MRFNAAKSSISKELRSPINGLQPLRHHRHAIGDTSPNTSKVALRKSLPVMLPSRRSKNDEHTGTVNDIAVVKQNSTSSNSPSGGTQANGQPRMPQPNWKQFRPELHKKTFFKGATSLTMGMEGSLNLYDDTARELVKHAYRVTGQEMPE